MTSAKQICSPDKIAEEVYVSVVAYAAEVGPRRHFGTKLMRDLRCFLKTPAPKRDIRFRRACV